MERKSVKDENLYLKEKIKFLTEVLEKRDTEMARLNQEIGRLSKTSLLRIVHNKRIQ